MKLFNSSAFMFFGLLALNCAANDSPVINIQVGTFTGVVTDLFHAESYKKPPSALGTNAR